MLIQNLTTYQCLVIDRFVTQLCLLFLHRLHTGAISLPPSDIILAELACPLSDIMFCLHKEWLTYLSLNIATYKVQGPHSQHFIFIVSYEQAQ